MRTIPTKSTVDFHVLKRLLLLQCVRYPTKSTAVFCILKRHYFFYSAYDTYKKYGCFLKKYVFKTITSFTVRHLQKVRLFSTKRRLFSMYLKLLLLQCVRYLQKVPTKKTPTKSRIVFYVLKPLQNVRLFSMY